MITAAGCYYLYGAREHDSTHRPSCLAGRVRPLMGRIIRNKSNSWAMINTDMILKKEKGTEYLYAVYISTVHNIRDTRPNHRWKLLIDF